MGYPELKMKSSNDFLEELYCWCRNQWLFKVLMLAGFLFMYFGMFLQFSACCSLNFGLIAAQLLLSLVQFWEGNRRTKGSNKGISRDLLNFCATCPSTCFKNVRSDHVIQGYCNLDTNGVPHKHRWFRSINFLEPGDILTLKISMLIIKIIRTHQTVIAASSHKSQKIIMHMLPSFIVLQLHFYLNLNDFTKNQNACSGLNSSGFWRESTGCKDNNSTLASSVCWCAEKFVMLK